MIKNLNSIQTDAPIACHVHRNNVIQSVAKEVTTKLLFTHSFYNIEDCFDTTTSAFRPKIPGYYLCVAGAKLSAGGPTEVALSIRKNNTAIINGGINTATLPYPATVQAVIYLDGLTDYVDAHLYYYYTSDKDVVGGPQYTFFQAIKIA